MCIRDRIYIVNVSHQPYKFFKAPLKWASTVLLPRQNKKPISKVRFEIFWWNDFGGYDQYHISWTGRNWGASIIKVFFCCFADETMVGACARRRVTFMYSCQRVFIDQFIFRTILIFNLEYLLTSTNQSAKLRDLKIVFWTLYGCFYSIWHIKPRADGSNIVGWYILRPFARPFRCYCMLLRVAVSFMPKVWDRSNVKLSTNGRNNSRHCWVNNCRIPVCIESMFLRFNFCPIRSSPELWMARIFSGNLICKWYKQELYLPRLISANNLNISCHFSFYAHCISKTFYTALNIWQ